VVCGPPSGSRKDLRNALEIAAKLGVRAQVSTYGLTQANEVLEKMQKGELHGRAVLVPL
jgi:propanol-preferring alcohol dehydrogenase